MIGIAGDLLGANWTSKSVEASTSRRPGLPSSDGAPGPTSGGLSAQGAYKGIGRS
jgi:hypothetical protein